MERRCKFNSLSHSGPERRMSRHRTPDFREDEREGCRMV
jgi:hypothetical protein